MKRRIFAAALACAATVAGLVGAAPAAQAATSVTFTPRTVTSPHETQYVAALGSVQLAMTAGQTAYVYSTLRANNASNTTLIDNEVRCVSTSGWTKNEVLGQNVLIASADAPASLRDIGVTTRFLVHPGAAGTVTCTTYLRSADLGSGNSTVRLVSGELKFADTSVANTTAGTPPQADDGDTPSGRVIALNSAAPTVREPATEVFETAPVTGLSVFGDMELMACYPEPANYDCPVNSMTARVTLFVNQWKADGTLCKSDASASETAVVRRDVHHLVVPLNTHFAAATGNGCVPKFNFYVKTDWLSGSTGAVQLAASGLPDAVGSTATHNDAMSHAFAVAY
ncbi:Uncharacterised protein [Amycolatopsis camponoti]|uniref:Uncharacterized protein n=1 Tax=Amycolatopsis camponoti TaxID=2606593 RepID=A0A6I8LNH9_9PSEU|nr:hypothetical protein [Amycolatopsis camponoti]VVJ18601.1 Uncharacterised protein [Amycolatopsis camponoti]